MRPEVRGARQNLLSEREDPLHVEIIERRRVLVNARQREFLAQLVALARVGVVVDRLFEQEGIVETIEPLLDRLGAAFGSSGRGS